LESGEEVRLYNDCFELKRSYQPDPYRWDRSALADVPPEHDLEKITRFKHWLGDLACFQVNPFAMSARAEVPQAGLAADLSNIAAWYWHSAALLRERAALIDNLRAVLDGFLDLVMLESIGGKVLAAEFVDEKGTKAIFRFNELSEGQRCLICLYAILHFVLAKGNTVVLDEPDNFVSLREIQPWLMAADDAVLDSGGQLLIISHHPEIINQWATSGGVRFVRDGIGPVRVEDFHSEPSYGLAPAELVARGWELG
jgi:predicted ATPase